MYKKTTFSNGVRVVSETIPHVHTASLGVWIDVGSRDEDASCNGISHFLEHMFFKGTRTRSARLLATDLDRLGGMANAFTSKDTTCLYSTVLHSQLTDLVEVLGEMFRYSSFAPEEINREQQVILQEIAMAEDTPEDMVGEIFEAGFWGEHSLHRSILGPADIVANTDRAMLTEYLSERYRADKVLISCAGRADHDEVCELLAPYFADGLATGLGPQRQAPRGDRPGHKQVVTKPLEQVQLIIGVDGMEVTSEERFKLVLLNILLGGNMSSRLFQQIREQRGLAYSISTFIESYIDCGMFGISCGVAPENVMESLAVIGAELASCGDIASYSKDEFARTLDYARASLYLSAENLEARMTRNARNELYFGRKVGLDEVMAEFNKVTMAEVAELGHTLFSRPLHATLFGPIAGNEVDWSVLG